MVGTVQDGPHLAPTPPVRIAPWTLHQGELDPTFPSETSPELPFVQQVAKHIFKGRRIGHSIDFLCKSDLPKDPKVV